MTASGQAVPVAVARNGEAVVARHDQLGSRRGAAGCGETWRGAMRRGSTGNGGHGGACCGKAGQGVAWRWLGLARPG